MVSMVAVMSHAVFGQSALSTLLPGLGKVKCGLATCRWPRISLLPNPGYARCFISLLQRFGHKFMRQIAVAVVLSLAALASAPSNAAAEMGPCMPDDHGSLACGNGDGAARVVPKTRSPSNRLALAWRLTNKPPSYRPNENDPDLESLIVRVEDGAILVKSPGTYWDIGERTAKEQYLSAAWSPDSRLLIRTAGIRDVSDSAELFAFAEDDSIVGPFDLAKVLDLAVRAQMKGVKDADKYVFGFSYKPELTIDDQGLIHASVYVAARDSGDGPIYNLTAQVTHAANSLDAKVLSVSQYLGPYISVTAH
jgi:hypothetical protein